MTDEQLIALARLSEIEPVCCAGTAFLVCKNHLWTTLGTWEPDLGTWEPDLGTWEPGERPELNSPSPWTGAHKSELEFWESKGCPLP